MRIKNTQYLNILFDLVLVCPLSWSHEVLEHLVLLGFSMRPCIGIISRGVVQYDGECFFHVLQVHPGMYISETKFLVLFRW